jgi:hydroxymethylbilane synthase
VTLLRIATRGSRLALAQSRWVAVRIEAALGVATELVAVRTSGDRLQDVSLAEVGGKGLFVKELEDALLAGRAELAVHSAKDLPARLPDGLVLAAFPERADPRDALVSGGRVRALAALPRGARVGTGSARRAALLRAQRPDLQVAALRGNVTTRLDRLDAGRAGDGALQAVILACAGLDRLGLAERIDERVDAGVLLPAVGQGVLAIEARAGEPLAEDLAALTHADTARAIAAERAFLARLQGDCNVPLAAFAEAVGPARLRLRGLVARPDGRRVVRGEAEGADPAALGDEVAEKLLAQGAREILAALRAGAAP